MNLLTRMLIAVVTFTLVGCTTSELVENWKNPDIDLFMAEKVLVLAMTNDMDNRKLFEKKLAASLRDQGVNAVVSDAFFSEQFTQRPRTLAELDVLENAMLTDGFDAILVSKIVSAEDKVNLIQAYKNFDRTFNNFEDDYRSSQGIYTEDEYIESYTVYHAETALYCICPTKDREIIWKGSIDITEPGNTRKAIKDYIALLTWALEEQNLLIPPTASDL